MQNEFNEEPQDFESTKFHVEELLGDILMDESIVSCELSRLSNICESFTEKLNTFISQGAENQQANAGKYIEMVANCQKQTAEMANAVFERHALNPAIKTVFTLTKLIRDLAEQSASLSEKQSSCPLIGPMLNSISEAVKLANDKCEYLGIEEISPGELDDFNAHEHEIKQTTTTDDKEKHKKVHRTLISGLKYRGKVLVPAQVSAYCFKN